MEEEWSHEVEEVKAALARIEAEYKERVFVLQERLAKSRAQAKSITDAAEAKIKKMSEDFNMDWLQRAAKIQ